MTMTTKGIKRAIEAKLGTGSVEIRVLSTMREWEVKDTTDRLTLVTYANDDTFYIYRWPPGELGWPECDAFTTLEKAIDHLVVMGVMGA